jgi:hypothetical protein
VISRKAMQHDINTPPFENRLTPCILIYSLTTDVKNSFNDRYDKNRTINLIKERTLRERIKLLESEIGKEVRYTHLSTEDFFYRLNLNDRLIRDVFDYQHKIVHDRLDIGLK